MKTKSIIALIMLIVAISSASILAQQWATLSPMPDAVMKVAVSAVNGKLYAMGGFSSDYTYPGNVYEYDPTLDSWTAKAPLPNMYTYVKSVSYNGKIYLTGDTGLALYILEFDPTLNSWTVLPGTTTSRSDFSLAINNGKLYVFGGWANAYTAAVEEYEISTNTWTTKTSMLTLRTGSAATEYGGKIYVAGGNNSGSYALSLVEVYDPASDTWTTTTPMNRLRRNLGVEVINDKLFAVGGYNGVFDPIMEEYDFVAQTWTETDTMITPRDRFGTGVIDSKIYVVGGTNGPFLATNEVFNPYAPTTPEGVSATAGNGFVTLEWTLDSGANFAFYNIYRSTTDGFNPVPGDSIGTVAVPDFTYTDNTVTNGTTYYYRISSVDTSDAMSGFSAQVSALPRDVTAPSAPVNLTAQPDNKRITLDWTGNIEPDLELYKIYRSFTSSFTPISSDSIGIVIQPNSSIVDGSLLNDSTYYYRIAAMDSTGNLSNFSSEVFATPFDSVRPTIPQNVIATGLNESIDLIWDTSPELDMHSYVIYRSTTDGFAPSVSDSISTLIAPDTTYSDSSVIVGIPYFYKLTAEDSVGNESDYSTQVSATPLDLVAPTAPQNLVGTDGDRFVQLDWSANIELDLSHYILYRSLVPGFTPNASDSLTIITEPDSSFRDSLIVVGTTYYYELSAVDTAFNESLFSNQVSGTPYDSTAPAIPSNFLVESGPANVSLTWDTNTEEDLLQYTIYRKTEVLPQDSLSLVYPPLNSFLDTVVTINDTFWYQISAVDSFGNESGFTAELYGIPYDATPPAAPQNLSAVSSNGLVSLTWNKNTELDMLSYAVLRGITDSTVTDTLGTNIQPDTTYADNSVVNGQTYYYEVVAVDSFSNYSASSNQVSATPAELIDYPWQPKLDMPTNRRGAVSGLLGGKIYVVGGIVVNSNTIVNEEYDPVLNSWDALKAELLTDREDFGGAVLSEKFYVVGGQIGNTRSPNNEAYKATTDSWETLTPLSIERRDLVLVTADNMLYAIGGRQKDTGYRDDVEEYDQNLDTWSYSSVMPTLRWGMAAAVVDGKIYVIGGDNGTALSTVEEYDPATDQWTTKTSMPTARRDLVANTIAGRIYAIGGTDGTVDFSTVEAYDPATDTWMTADTMITPRSDLSSASYNDILIYAFGGIDDSGTLTTNEEFNPRPWLPLNPAILVEPAQLSLSWSPNVEPDLDFYVIYRDTTDGFIPELDDIIARVAKEDTSYSDSDIESVTTYYYRISAVDSVGQESITYSDQISATTSNYALSLGSIDSTFTNGDTITVPLTLFGTFNGAGVTSFQFTVEYDSVQFNGVSVDTTGSGLSAIFFSNITQGNISVAAVMFDTLQGANKVMNLIFEVDDDARRGTTSISFDEAFFNEGIPVLDISTTEIAVWPRYGDVSGNTTINSYDASLVLQNVVGIEEFSIGRSEKADVTYNGSVTAQDAFFILLKSASMISTFPVDDSLASKVAMPSNRELLIEHLPELIENDRKLKVTFNARNVESINSLFAELQFDPDILEYKHASFDKDRNILYADNAANGRLALAMTGTSPIESDGKLLTLTFIAKPEYTDENILSAYHLLGIDVNDIPAEYVALRGENANLPKIFDLKQNYPNPFNPMTTIQYQLPEESYVAIKIFNILGQEIRTLLRENRKGGFYSIKWDSRNNLGKIVSPGIYFIRIKAGHYVKIKKMTLIK